MTQWYWPQTTIFGSIGAMDGKSFPPFCRASSNSVVRTPHQQQLPNKGEAAFAQAWAALTRDPAQQRPELRPAAALMAQGQLDAAVQVLQRLLADRPNDADAFFLAGEIARRRGSYPDAEMFFARALS